MTPGEVLADDPLWLTLKVVVVFALLMVMTLFLIWFERRVVGRMQHRPGPNRHGPFGLLQSLADGLKLAFKEDIRPVLADKWVYFLAPTISAIPAFVAFSVVPIGGQVTIFGEETLLQVADLQVACWWCWPARRSACTASCSAAGPPARRTRCSVRCARRRR
jgi:NADH:ubiquinone oxidoreductase subunit 1 (chain H)